MKAAIVCIAKDEDKYIDEWLGYHLKLGFSKAFVYQNDWRYAGDRGAYGDAVEWIEFDGPCAQLKAYNDFLANRRGDLDFAAFFDVDEYMCLAPGLALGDFLRRFSRCAGVALNWRLFGDSGLAAPSGDWSCAKRFVRRQAGYNEHVKTIVNLKTCGSVTGFVTPHSVNLGHAFCCVADASGTRWVRGPFNRYDGPELPAWLNHYFCKTKAEWEAKKAKGRADVDLSRYPEHARKDSDFDAHNFNDVEDLTARDFLLGKERTA